MPGPIDESLRKFHASLNVSDLDRSIAFYRVLFGVEPAKVRRDYAKFELADPGLVLSLIPGRPDPGGHLNHAGLRLRDAGELVEVQKRLETAGIATKREDGVECCYARQTKFWVTDPDRALWEIYVFHEDTDDHGHDHVPDLIQVARGAGSAATLAVPAPKPRNVWTHRLREPVPARVPHDDNSLHEARLEGSINVNPDTAHRAGLFADLSRALRPGAQVQIHGLAGDRPSPRAAAQDAAGSNGASGASAGLGLPGPAADVQYVPTPGEVARELLDAGFVDVHLETLSATAYFVVDGVEMRELRISGRKLGHRPQTAAHRAVYLGPLREVTDDFGNLFRRGDVTLLNVHDWQALSKGPARESFLLLGPAETGGAAGVSASCDCETTPTAAPR